MPLPNFIVIGAMKCGTSSLTRYLKHHPQIGLTTKKESNFFSRDRVWSKGLPWYKNQFNTSGANEVYGDISPSYSKCHMNPEIPKRIHQVVPDVKLIYLVRNPIERFNSHYVHNYSKMQTNLSYSAYVDLQLENNGNALRTGLYMNQLDHFLKFFSTKQLLVIKSEDLRSNRRSTLKTIYDFLEVKEFFDDEIVNREYHSGRQRVRPGKLIAWSHRYPALFHKLWKLRGGPVNPLRRLLFESFERPKITEKQILKLTDYFRPDSLKLAHFAKIDIKDWYN